MPRLQEWSDSHSSAFKPTKTEATIFLPSARELPDNPPPIILQGLKINYTSTLTMLGTKLDSRLLFHDYVTASLPSTTAISLLTRSKAGLVLKWACQLVIARQRWAVTGGFRSAAGEALDIVAGLLPIYLQLQDQLFHLALRALTAPPSHPLHAHTAVARSRPALVSYRSPLDLTLTNPLLPSNLAVETIHPNPNPALVP
ncbi:hypothetical protein JCM10021v2_004864 [Rhodotorula toruloides]